MKCEFKTSLKENVEYLKTLLPIGRSVDVLSRTYYFGDMEVFFVGMNGLSDEELLQRILSELVGEKSQPEEDLKTFIEHRIGYAETVFTDDWKRLVKDVMSGQCALLAEGMKGAILLDVRCYPVRSTEEPDTEKTIRGARDGFVETMLFNTNLIRRRIRNPKLIFEPQTIGSDSMTDVAIGYVEGVADMQLVEKVKQEMKNMDVSSLTMGYKSMEEMLVRKKWYHPLPSMMLTERPDTACSYLLEGYIVVIVDNTPEVLILPSTIFQFTQSVDDYYKGPLVGTYFRLIRLLCILGSLFLMPVFLLLTTEFREFSLNIKLLQSADIQNYELLIYVLMMEFGLDLFRYSSAHTSSRYSGALSIVGGLIAGDVIIDLNWASAEVVFYAAITLLTTLSLSSYELGEAIRIYRLLLILATGIFGIGGFVAGIILIIISVITTPSFAGKSFFWPLVPFNWSALKTLLFRYPTYRSQPGKVWSREK